MSSPQAIAVRQLAKAFVLHDGRHLPALAEVSFEVAAGAFVAIVGPSGCGKSTLLHLIAGLEAPTAGSVEIGAQPVSGVVPDIAYVFQADALLPWKTVLEAVALPLLFRGVPRIDALERARVWVARVGLSGFERHYPSQLSGGMRKRVSLAASLVYEPAVLLMDEPFAALDVQTRFVVEQDLLEIWASTGRTCLFVTHDLEEAITLADRVIVLSKAPTRVKMSCDVPLPRPRHLVESKLDPRFVDVHRTLWRALSEEVSWR